MDVVYWETKVYPLLYLSYCFIFVLRTAGLRIVSQANYVFGKVVAFVLRLFFSADYKLYFWRSLKATLKLSCAFFFLNAVGGNT